MLPSSSWTSPRRALALLAVWLLATLGVRPLLVPDEGRYANVAREMLQGDGLTPLLNGLPFFHKPPLMYWLDMAAMSVVGVNHFSARFGTFIGAWLMGAALYLAVRRWHGERPALAALLTLATTPFFFVGGQYGNLDMMVGGMLTATILAFARAADDERPELRWVLAAWSLAALSVLAKGLIGIVLPALVLGPWLLVRGQWRVVLRLLNPLGIAVFVLIGLPWFALMQHRYPGFFDYFVMEQHFRRFAQTHFNNVHPWWFFLAVLPALTLPWSLWIPRAWTVVSPEDRARMGLYVWWIAAIVGFFSLPSSKLVGYILPALAPWCLLLSMAASHSGRWRMAAAAAGALAGLAAVVALTIKSPHSAQPVARELASRMAPADRVVFVDEVYFDLSYDANLKRPAIILSDWSSPDIPRRDNWRKELWDAARFDPVQAQAVLWQLDRAAELSCGDTPAWFVLKPGNERLLAGVPGIEAVAVHGDVKLMRAPARRC